MAEAPRAELAALPIDALRGDLLSRLAEGPVVVTSPTGSGKSTQIPRWCPGPVLVVEPRRVACRTLASRVAELEGSRLGEAVGYHVRDDLVSGPATRVLFATPGIVLRSPGMLDRFATVVLDELHERTLEIDLLLALLVSRKKRGLVVMSATLEGERVASHVGGSHLHCEVRSFPVEVRYLGEGSELPDPANLDQRVRRAIEGAPRDAGDVLVFLPGKAEIAQASRALSGLGGLEVLELHGGLSLEQQARAFRPSRLRKVVLSTNVAETSVTIPGVGVVIDSGLVRQTRYHQGRGFLTLCPIASDSAEQRAGRAGRTGPGHCLRLWSQAAALAARTPPEVQRESLVPLLLSASAWGEDPARLPMLDPPKDYALEAARDELSALGALSPSGSLTPLGKELFDLPLDAPLARLLVEARGQSCLGDVVDLVAALSVGRPLFAPGPRPDDPADDLRLAGCDVTALVRAVREGDPARHGLLPASLDEARSASRRLRRGVGLPERAAGANVDRDAVVWAALRADPRSVHVVRRRGREVAFSNGGTELEIGRESALKDLERLEAVVVLATTAIGLGRRDTRVLITCATPVPLSWLVKAGLGRDRLGEVQLERGRVVARVERVYARKVLATREETPRGEVAREAIAALYARGRVFPAASKLTRERLRAHALASRLARAGLLDRASAPLGEVPELEAWAQAKLAELGVEGGDDLALLSEADLTAPDVPPEARAVIDRETPLTVNVGDALYEVDYDFGKRQATLRLVKGNRKDPPPSHYLPRLAGLRVCVEGPKGTWVVRP